MSYRRHQDDDSRRHREHDSRHRGRSDKLAEDSRRRGRDDERRGREDERRGREDERRGREDERRGRDNERVEDDSSQNRRRSPSRRSTHRWRYSPDSRTQRQRCPSHPRAKRRSRSRSSPTKKQRLVEVTGTSGATASPSKRRWKFDSPPRDQTFDGVGSGTGLVATSASGPLSINGVPGTISQLYHPDGCMQPSAMGILAQSLGLSSEQQKAARELYIGNLPQNLDVNQLIDFFNAAMLTLNASGIPGPPVSRAWIAADGHFAFVEFRTIEEATIALQLNGLNCMGYALRIGRPKTYPAEYASLLSSTAAESHTGPDSPAAAALAAATAAAASVSSNPITAMRAAQVAAAGIGTIRRPLPDRPERLVLVDLPHSSKCSPDEVCLLSLEHHYDHQVKKLLGQYGTLKVFGYFEVSSERSGRPMGACVVEYAEMGQQKAIEKAVRDRDIDGMKVKLIPANEAIHDERISKAMQDSRLQDETGEDLMKPQVATRVIMLENLVTRNELVDDKEYFDILDDVNHESTQYGKVISVEIPRPLSGTRQPNDDESDVGFAFVKFAKLQGAGAARKGLSGRKFAGRTVEAHYFSELKFKERDFKHPKPNFDASGRMPDSPGDANSEVTETKLARFDVAPADS